MKRNLGLAMRPVALILFIFLTAQSFAQDKSIDINLNVDKGDDNFFAKPWVWVLGGAVFILLLVALLRSGKKD